jgi:hypothetical protein
MNFSEFIDELYKIYLDYSNRKKGNFLQKIQSVNLNIGKIENLINMQVDNPEHTIKII